ncbi:MAG: cupin domain-containing protein, partial [Paracoccaceae bacterium]
MSKDSNKPHAMQPEDTPELRALYRGFEENHLNPLWTQTANLMPPHPKPEAVAHIWEWEKLYELAKRSGDLVPVGRGGERRAIGLANPGLGGRAYISPTLWAAVQYLGPRENAPEHRHAQNAFRFVLEGEGVWTVVDGDPIHMSRGDLLLTPGWQFHGHQNISDKPMAWLDGLDIPFSQQMDVGFFEFGADQVSNLETPESSRGER